ncbi:hypothetical protein [Phreatobacter oligotrophus]|uniref:hypothetical protein n=1 Tax=Phreatobacter oligotrophus TaxID=1122261 RepID=UPI002352FD24|nr:hypothetical protein [Phreatobacter oligotrophus]MBX9989330.1 hypothetical protein [Phreatobacter oligotrophus]
MPSFRTAVIDRPTDTVRRLADFALTIDQILAIRDAAKAAADDASPLMPLNAPGTLAYIHGVDALRRQLLDGEWEIDRTLGVEAVINRRLAIRIAFQNVDQSCDAVFPPRPRSDKGSGAAKLCALPLFEHFGVILETDWERVPGSSLEDDDPDSVTTYFVMVGEDGSVELSSPVIDQKKYVGFRERIFVDRPDGEWAIGSPADEGPVDGFDVEVVFKEAS